VTTGFTIFRLGSGIKFRASVSSLGSLYLELRQPNTWVPVTAPDLQNEATQALGLAAIGSPPKGFTFTTDDRYTESIVAPNSPSYSFCNPFAMRYYQRYGCYCTCCQR